MSVSVVTLSPMNSLKKWEILGPLGMISVNTHNKYEPMKLVENKQKSFKRKIEDTIGLCMYL